MHDLPTAAQALLVALQTPNARGQMGIPALVWGAPGEGKTSFVEGLAAEGFPVLALIASIHDPTDFSGLPMHHDGSVRYAAPEWVKIFEKTGSGLLFLDELTTAPPAVQAALLRVVLERKVGFHSLPDGVRVVAAANPPSIAAGGWELSPPLRNRFVHLQWSLSAETFVDALENGFKKASLPEIPAEKWAAAHADWQLRIAAFLRRAPDLLAGSPENGSFGFPTPRSWDNAIALMASCEVLGLTPLQNRERSAVFSALVRGCLGDGATVALLEFLQNLRLPDPEKVLDGLEKIDVAGLNDAEAYVFFGSLTRAILRRMDGDSLVDSSIRFFDLTERIAADGRRDLIYVFLRKAAREGLLTRALARAQSAGPTEREQVLRAINSLFSDEGLTEFIDIFEGKKR